MRFFFEISFRYFSRFIFILRIIFCHVIRYSHKCGLVVTEIQVPKYFNNVSLFEKCTKFNYIILIITINTAIIIVIVSNALIAINL